MVERWRSGNGRKPGQRASSASCSRRESRALRSSRAAKLVDPKTRGWHEQLARDGRVLSDAQNATSLYHIVTALEEATQALEG